MRVSHADGRVHAQTDGAIGWLVLDHPERHNALTIEMQRAIPMALEALAAEPEVRVVVVRGAGDRAFAAGADISEFDRERTASQDRDRYRDVGAAMGRSFAELDIPVLAMVHGHCLGGGLALALHCDLRLASQSARFAIPAARLGVGYGFAGVKTLVDLIGSGAAARMLYSARALDSATALRLGLVDEVLPEDRLEEEVRQLAKTIAENAPLTLAAARHALRQCRLDPGERDLERNRALVEACFESQDYIEGRRAFLEKRAPRFRGR